MLSNICTKLETDRLGGGGGGGGSMGPRNLLVTSFSYWHKKVQSQNFRILARIDFSAHTTVRIRLNLVN